MRKGGIGCLVLVAGGVAWFVAWFAHCGPVIMVKRDVPLLAIPEFPTTPGQRILRIVKAGERVKVFSTTEGKDTFHYKVITRDGEHGYIIYNSDDVPCSLPGPPMSCAFFRFALSSKRTSNSNTGSHDMNY